MSAATDRSALVAWAVGPAFLALAAWLALASPRVEIPTGSVRLIPRSQLTPGAWRTPLTDARLSVVNGAARPCSDCHKLFTPSPVENRTLVQHKDVVLHHGMNARCFNCHHASERDNLVLHDGTLVPFSETPRLCSQCHGTVYRDWQLGMHGKTMGSWDPADPRHLRLTCNQCHDPHAPAYAPLEPLPGPDTMRMGDQDVPRQHDGRHTPLRQWSSPHAPSTPNTPSAPEAPHPAKEGP